MSKLPRRLDLLAQLEESRLNGHVERSSLARRKSRTVTDCGRYRAIGRSRGRCAHGPSGETDAG